MTNDERVNCKECACFEPMKAQKSEKLTIGSCHLFPPIFTSESKVAKWPIVFKEHGYCFTGIRKIEE